MQSKVTLNKAFTVDKVDPRIYSGFIEHLGRAVYGGVYEPGHATADEEGFRGDVMDLIRELDMPMQRYPGGNFVSGYNWEDGVGPKDQRPARLDLAWRAVEPNTFGTNEFASWCRKMNTQAMMAVNLGTRGIDDARNLLEYCNHPGGSALSDLRREHGCEKPHDIKTWCLGNEMDGSWQMGHKKAVEYARIAKETANIMRMYQRDLELVVCGTCVPSAPWFGEYDLEVLKECYPLVDHISAHVYYNNHKRDTPHFLSKPDEMDRQIKSMVSVCDTAMTMRKMYGKKIHICFDEWNVWYHSNEQENKTEDWTVGKPILEDVYNMEDVLVVGGMLMTLLQNCDRVKIACIAQTVNVIAPIMTETGGPAWRQTIFYPFFHASKWGRGSVLRSVVETPTYENADQVPTPYLQTVSVLSDDEKHLTLFAVNRNLDEEMEIEVDLQGLNVAKVEETIMMQNEDLRAVNTKDDPDNVVPFALDGVQVADGKLKAKLGKASWNVVRLALA